MTDDVVRTISSGSPGSCNDPRLFPDRNGRKPNRRPPQVTEASRIGRVKSKSALGRG